MHCTFRVPITGLVPKTKKCLKKNLIISSYRENVINYESIDYIITISRLPSKSPFQTLKPFELGPVKFINSFLSLHYDHSLYILVNCIHFYSQNSRSKLSRYLSISITLYFIWSFSGRFPSSQGRI